MVQHLLLFAATTYIFAAAALRVASLRLASYIPMIYFYAFKPLMMVMTWS